MSTQTFSKPFLFSNNKEKLKTNYFYSYWAGPWKRTGPRPQPACVARALGSAAAWQGLRPTAALAQLGRSEGDTPAPRLRGGAARPAAGGHCRSGQDKRASAGGSRGVGECEQAAKQGGEGEEGEVPRRPSTVAPWPTAAKHEECATLAQKTSQP